MNFESILERFILISGLTYEEAAFWEPILNEACEEIRRRLKETTDEQLESVRLNAAAAALGFYKYALYRASQNDVESFSAGDISIKSNDKDFLNRANLVWLEAKNSVADLLQDDEFLFYRTCIC